MAHHRGVGHDRGVTTALEQWTADLRAWAIPEDILAAAPENPYAFPPGTITTPTIDPLKTPTGQRVRERLSPGDRLLDVGCGAARIAGAFTADYDVIGVEPRENLAAVARDAGVDVRLGMWPQLAGEVGTAPVVVTTHVLYDVQEPTAFLRALDAAATRRVVIEVTAAHPWAGIGRFYERFHGISRPDGPTASQLADVISEVLGVVPERDDFTRPRGTYTSLDDLVGHYRRMVCLTEAADDELATMLAEVVIEVDDGVQLTGPARACTLWWDR